MITQWRQKKKKPQWTRTVMGRNGSGVMYDIYYGYALKPITMRIVQTYIAKLQLRHLFCTLLHLYIFDSPWVINLVDSNTFKIGPVCKAWGNIEDHTGWQIWMYKGKMGTFYYTTQLKYGQCLKYCFGMKVRLLGVKPSLFSVHTQDTQIWIFDICRVENQLTQTFHHYYVACKIYWIPLGSMWPLHVHI